MGTNRISNQKEEMPIRHNMYIVHTSASYFLRNNTIKESQIFVGFLLFILFLNRTIEIPYYNNSIFLLIFSKLKISNTARPTLQCFGSPNKIGCWDFSPIIYTFTDIFDSSRFSGGPSIDIFFFAYSYIFESTSTKPCCTERDIN